jgi:hypothetical protein
MNFRWNKNKHQRTKIIYGTNIPKQEEQIFINKETKCYASGNKMNFTGNKTKHQGTKKSWN